MSRLGNPIVSDTLMADREPQGDFDDAKYEVRELKRKLLR